MNLFRAFKLDNEKFTVACNKTNLNVMSSRGVLTYPVEKHSDTQKQQIFDSRIPEYIAGRDLGEAGRLLMSIESGAALCK
jgi:hypothetical protein